MKFTVGQTATSLGGDTGGDVLPWAAALLVMIAWTAVFLLAAALVDQRRESPHARRRPRDVTGPPGWLQAPNRCA